MLDCLSNKSKEDQAILSDQDDLVEGDENQERGNWSSKTEYMMSMVGYAVGLGNIWRFPYLAYKNGGGAFLIPYFLMLVLCGVPLFFLETAVSQFCSQGPLNLWRAVPILKGLGFAMIVANTLVSIYYNVIIAYGLYYLFASFQSPLPWASCFSWADGNCSSTPIVHCNMSGVIVTNVTELNITCPLSDQIYVPVQSPSEQYWDRVALQRSSGMDETGPVVWHLALCLLLGCCLISAALCKGIKSSGKVVYFTAPFPYVVIFILLIRGVSLEGAADGINYYIGSKSDFSKLADVQVWQDAATQTLFSLSVGWGGLMTLASYNTFHNDMMKDSIVVSLLNHGSSVYAGFAIFSILGHMSFIYGTPVDKVVKEGFGLAFIAYPAALAKLPFAPLWSILFFLMIVVVGMDSEFAMIEVIGTSITDTFPQMKSKRPLVTLVTCVSVFLLGLPCVTRAGIYWVTLLDYFAAGWVLLIIGLIEVLGFSYIYGGQSLVKDIEMMIGPKSKCYWLCWKLCWYFISPCITFVILILSLVYFEAPSYAGVAFPEWGVALGWCTVIFILFWVPATSVYNLLQEEGSLWTRVKKLTSPAENWHPFLEIHRGERYSEEMCQLRNLGSTKDDAM